jgi:tryptophan synthase alpha chain
VAVGFGLSRPEHIREIGACADAAVVGSALVDVIAREANSSGLVPAVERYVAWLRSDATSDDDAVGGAR